MKKIINSLFHLSLRQINFCGKKVISMQVTTNILLGRFTIAFLEATFTLFIFINVTNNWSNYILPAKEKRKNLA